MVVWLVLWLISEKWCQTIKWNTKTENFNGNYSINVKGTSVKIDMGDKL